MSPDAGGRLAQAATAFADVTAAADARATALDEALAAAAELAVAASDFAGLPLPLTAAAMTPITKRPATERRTTFRFLGGLRCGFRGGGACLGV
jgi:hypothetical protein